MLFDRFSSLVQRQRPRMVEVDGSRLTRCGPSAWLADRELAYGGRHRLPVRMVVLQAGDGSLILYSPVALDDGTVEALAGLGPVAWIVVPNRFHTLFVGRAMDVYPDARLLLPPTDGGLGERFPRRAQTARQAVQLDQDIELLPVRLRDGLEELVIYHDPAELLMVGDLLFNFQQAERLSRWLYRFNGVWRRPGVSRLQRLLLLKDPGSLGEFYRWAMNKPFSQISMAHGQLVGGNAREVFYQLFHHFSGR